MDIKLKDIKPCPWNPRGEITPESVKELADNIDKIGLINPITIWRAKAVNEWWCIAGCRRLAALKSLHTEEGLESANIAEDCYVEYGGNMTEAQIITTTENLQREDIGVLEEAKGVADLYAAGLNVDEVAARLGKSTAWVRRRTNLLHLTDEWKEHADEVTVEALEHVATYPSAIQQAVAKHSPWNWSRHWDSLKRDFDAATRDLSCAKFPTDECRECCARTGAQADLFGDVADGALGRCTDCKCFADKLAAWRKAEVERRTKGAAEVEKIAQEWSMPHGDEYGKRHDKKHPCAYYCWTYNDELKVVWGPSAKAKKDAEKAEQKRAQEERAAINAERAKYEEISAKLNSWKCKSEQMVEDEDLEAVITDAFALTEDTENTEALDYILDAVVCKVREWKDCEEWAETLRAFPGIAALAGVTDEERDDLLARFTDKEGGN